MRTAPLNEVSVCVFDAYGTLFDLGAAARCCADELGDDAGKLAALWRDKQLQYTWLRATQARHADFWQVTGDALDFALEAIGIERSGLRERLMNLYLALDAFPDVRNTLERLKAAGMRTAILSNGTPAMLSAAVSSAQLATLLESIFSVEEVGVFKPHQSVYRLAAERMGVPAHAIAFVSSNAWDAHAASASGMRVVWCNRYEQCRERLPGAPDFEIRSLMQLPGVLGIA